MKTTWIMTGYWSEHYQKDADGTSCDERNDICDHAMSTEIDALDQLAAQDAFFRLYPRTTLVDVERARN